MNHLFAIFALLAFTAGPLAYAAQTKISGPAGSALFGVSVTVLSNGNFVVTDPNYSIPGGATNVGAVYLYDGQTLALISTLTGSTNNDYVGEGGVTALANGNYVVSSRDWANGGATNAGAVTWGSGTAGVTGAVSAANSLVGSRANDQVGYVGVTALANGNYVVRSRDWANGGATNAGAVTWGSGTAGVTGAVSAANSLVGSRANDLVGEGGVTALANGNYVVRSRYWDNGGAADAGAVTWGSGTGGVTGAVSAANSLVGSTANDRVGEGGVTVLANGNYVVGSLYWANGGTANAGAVTWGSGTGGVTGAVSAANSLVGNKVNNWIGDAGVTVLANGNYVVRSRYWANVGAAEAGAVTWGSGTTGITGVVSADNSLVGSTANDQVGYVGVTALANGNYVVSSRYWDNGSVADAGAVTWGSGEFGVTGAVSAANSLVGSTLGDQVGDSGVTALANGNYVVRSRYWDNGGATEAGAVTWGSGTTGITGVVSADNSLVGSMFNDRVGAGGVMALANGNYVVCSPYWANGGTDEAGAVTWGNGEFGVTGAVSVANSLVGSTRGDQVGDAGVTVLANGNYVVRSTRWVNGAATYAGAATWGNGTAGVTGAVSAANSLIGSMHLDQIGSGGVTALANGNYLVCSPCWANGGAAYAGAATWGSGAAGVAGAVSAANSLVGSMLWDQVGDGGVTALTNGTYVVSPKWANGGATEAGAVTWVSGVSGMTGAVSAANSLVGDVTTGGDSMVVVFNPAYTRLMVGYPAGNCIILSKQNQLITNFTPANGSAFVTTNTVELSAAGGGSTNPVVFEVASGPGVIMGLTNLAFTNYGLVSVQASQAGDDNWAPAPPATNTFTVTRATAVVSIGNLGQTYNGAARTVTTSTAPAGLPLTVTYDGNTWAPTNAGSYVVTGLVDSAHPLYQGTSVVTLTVGKAEQTIDFVEIPSQKTTNTVALSATASSGLPVSFTNTPGSPVTWVDSTTIAFTGAGVVRIVASQAGNANWCAASNVTNNFNVTQQPPSAPTGVAASDGIYTDKVRITWNAVSAGTSFQVWRHTANAVGAAAQIGTTAAIIYDDTSAGLETTYYYWVKAVNVAGTSAFSAVDAGYPGVVGPLISVNGLIGDNVVLAAVTPLTIAVEMMNLPAAYIGYNVDWWVAAYAHTGNLWYYLNSDIEFIPFDGNLSNCRPAYQGPLMNLPLLDVAWDLHLAPGTYSIWFAVDYPMDGILRLDGPMMVSRITMVVE